MKFKKHISIFLTVLFLVSNVGYSFYVHYCGDSISSVTLKPTTLASDMKSEGDCCQKISTEKERCCKDKKIVVQKKTEDKIFKSVAFEFSSVFLVPKIQLVVFETVVLLLNKISIAYHCDANAPPLFKLYNQYLLYDIL
ncbi:HYC_CC_PP family protein [Flavobacterium adhaerens]|uniref:HYC_CC_PP family protein n=1 Tax=Flavobacterium adhaerens TaxID=3149043 RepID=UPI003F6928F3